MQILRRKKEFLHVPMNMGAGVICERVEFAFFINENTMQSYVHNSKQEHIMNALSPWSQSNEVSHRQYAGTVRKLGVSTQLEICKDSCRRPLSPWLPDIAASGPNQILGGSSRLSGFPLDARFVAAEALSQQQYRRVGSSSCRRVVSVSLFFYNVLLTCNQTALVGIFLISDFQYFQSIYTLCVTLNV